MQVFQIPKVFGSERLDTIISLFEFFKGNKEAILDWKKVETIEPAGFALLSIIVDQSVEKECKLTFRNVPRAFSTILAKYKELEKSKVLPIPASHDLFFPTSFSLCCQGAIDLRYKDLLENKFSYLHEDLRFSIQLVFNELIQNAVDHSTSERYYVYFGVVEDEVHLGVLDMGVSLPAKLEQKYEADSDLAFLELSLKEGITTRRQRPGGLGLFHTLELIKDLKGKFVLISRVGQIRRYFSQRKVNRMEMKHRLPGTWAMFTFKIPKVAYERSDNESCI